NLPLNGRSLQTLISLSPGIVAMPVAGNGGNQGQFSVNGQRTNANYFTVDGVSGNFSVTNFEGLGQNGSGSIPTTSITGSFASLANELRRCGMERTKPSFSLLMRASDLFCLNLR